MAATKVSILAAIDKCIRETRSTRKQMVGLPLLKKEMMNALDLRDCIRLLLIACREPEPKGASPPNTASKYWVNRHSGRWSSGKTSTRKCFEAIIQEYRQQFPEALRPRMPVVLDKNTVINPAMIAQMRAASRRRDGEIVLLGHGETVPNKTFIVPIGTTVKFYVPKHAFLRDIDVRAIAAPEVWGLHEKPSAMQIVHSGQTADEHLIGELDAQGLGCIPAQLGATWIKMPYTRGLSTILQPYMGTVHFAACRSLPDNPAWDPIDIGMKALDDAGGIQNDPGSEPLELTDEQLRVLAEKGGRPSE